MEKRLFDYLQRILNARVYDVAIESPLDLAQKLSQQLSNQISVDTMLRWQRVGTIFGQSDFAVVVSGWTETSS